MLLSRRIGIVTSGTVHFSRASGVVSIGFLAQSLPFGQVKGLVASPASPAHLLHEICVPQNDPPEPPNSPTMPRINGLQSSRKRAQHKKEKAARDAQSAATTASSPYATAASNALSRPHSLSAARGAASTKVCPSTALQTKVIAKTDQNEN